MTTIVTVAAVGFVPVALVIWAAVIDRHGPAPLVWALRGAAAAVYLALVGMLSYYRCHPPQGWLVHFTSDKARDAMVADQATGNVHLKAGSRLLRVPLLAGAHPFGRRLCFFDRVQPARWHRFNLPVERRTVAVWVRAEDLAAHNRRFFRRCLLDGAVAWPGIEYRGPAVVKPGSDSDLVGHHFGPEQT